jgi:hypothetical protein
MNYPRSTYRYRGLFNLLAQQESNLYAELAIKRDTHFHISKTVSL